MNMDPYININAYLLERMLNAYTWRGLLGSKTTLDEIFDIPALKSVSSEFNAIVTAWFISNWSVCHRKELPNLASSRMAHQRYYGHIHEPSLRQVATEFFSQLTGLWQITIGIDWDRWMRYEFEIWYDIYIYCWDDGTLEIVGDRHEYLRPDHKKFDGHFYAEIGGVDDDIVDVNFITVDDIVRMLCIPHRYNKDIAFRPMVFTSRIRHYE